MMNIDIIKEIKDLLNENNKIYDGNLYSFSYTKNQINYEENKNFFIWPSITITGKDSIEKYNELYKKLFNNIVTKKSLSLSLKTFMEATQNLLFENAFTEENILDLVNSYKEISIVNVRKIYGLSMEKDFVTYGKYTFIKKEYINRYLENYQNEDKFSFNDSILNDDLDFDFSSQFFVFVIVRYKALDNLYTKPIMDKEMNILTNIIRYMTPFKSYRFKVDSIPFMSYKIDYMQFTNEGKVTKGTDIIRKDLCFPIDNDIYMNSTKGNDIIFQIISKSQPTELEKRIIQALIWVGKALEENDNSLIIAEISFAFETLLYNSDDSYVSKGVVASISEAYAFINGINCEERIAMEKDFKNFYNYRSKICHGTRLVKSDELSVDGYFNMIQNTITNLLTKYNFKSCSSCQDIYNTLQRLKYK